MRLILYWDKCVAYRSKEEAGDEEKKKEEKEEEDQEDNAFDFSFHQWG